MMGDQYAGDQWQDRWMTEVHKLGDTLGAMHTTNPWPDILLLPAVMNYLITELWDRGFSQTEIREAFASATSDLPRYAAGDERRL
jgi:hypothetical protein